ncbi:protein gamma response 1 [Quillaja saponaria]|uniref:Protein gamma response 1 n=1 Tax=Quillaja saponaria TaxID=32244 RepID=A0AAD7QK81_QUISA|nr:protein gamma response 1 [Quillaja saponaria]
MDGLVNPQKSPKLGYPIDGDDEKYVSGLSTILVATIQEAKDRISQIEYIFCSQLYPNFQLKSKTLNRFYSELRKSVENEWKEKEINLLDQIEKMQNENQRVLDENRFLKLENQNAKSPIKQELLSRQCRIDELERELRKKIEEVDDGMKLQKDLVEMTLSKASLIVEKEKQLKDNEEKTKGLLAKVGSLEEEIVFLKHNIRRKTELVQEEEILREGLSRDIAKATSEIENLKEEKKQLKGTIENMEWDAARIQRELRFKIDEIEEGRDLKKQLIQQLDLKKEEILKNKQQLDLYSREQDSHDNFLKLVESKKSELLSEKQKRRDLIDAYKRLKSQYNFLCTKFGLTTENMLHQNKLEDESDSGKSDQNLIAANGLGNKNPDTATVAYDTNKVKTEINDNEGGSKLNCASIFHVPKKCASNAKSVPVCGPENKILDASMISCGENKAKNEMFEDEDGAKPSSPSSGVLVGSKCPSSAKSVSLSGKKRPASSWRETRSRQCRGGDDPHDDFLDTPLENIKENINKAQKEDNHHTSGLAHKDTPVDSSDDETQDMNANPVVPKQQSPVPLASKKNFKYIETVRKKAERENMKGIECKQCKKFYDAVLPVDQGKSPDISEQSFRCEHHDGVSRHRYRYVPPLTPEGFWNIGFESEM